MISLRDVVTGFGSRDPLAEVWRRSLRGGGGGSAVIIGVPPLRYIGDGRPLTDYLISGNTVQDGTPTPENPVDAVGSGVRAWNLLDESTASDVDATHVNYNKSVPIFLTAGQTYTFSCDTVCNGLYIRSSADDSSLASANNSATLTYTPQVNVGVYCRVWNSNGITNLKPMLNLGSTALPYEPYGYKLPLTVNATEHPIYLGQVETTRRVKKLVLTGEETINFASEDANRVVGYFVIPTMGMKVGETGYCNILLWKDSYSQSEYNRIVANGSTRFYMSLAKSILPEPTIDGFIAYLKQQYASGTPVTVWYVLAEPETAIVNEPLMKIGGYADTISFAQAGVTIPTVSGENILDVPTEVPPSEVTIKGGISSV